MNALRWIESQEVQASTFYLLASYDGPRMAFVLQDDGKLLGHNDSAGATQSVPHCCGLRLRVATREIVQNPLEERFDA